MQGVSVVPEAMRRLYLLAAALVLSAIPATAGSRLPDTDLPGGDYRSFALISPLPSLCEQVCSRDSRCRAWTMAWPGKRDKRARCFLKEKVPEKHPDTCCISGIRGAAPSISTGGGTESATPPSSTPPSSTPPAATTGSGGDAGAEETTAGGTTPPPAAGGSGPAAPPGTGPATRPGTGSDDMTAALDEADRRYFCEAYADAAVRASMLNRQLGCGYDDGRWGASRRGYFNWCMRNPRRRALENTRARQRLIDACRDNPRPRRPPSTPQPEADLIGGPAVPPAADLESCTVYARLSIAQAQRARRLHCGYFGPDWSLRFGRHFAACRQMTVGRRRQTLAMRRRQLQLCESGRPARVRPPQYRRAGPPAPFLYQWVQIRGRGRWRSGWRPSVSGKCPLVSACECGPETCGVYPPGTTALMWRDGCMAPPAVVQCRVRRAR